MLAEGDRTHLKASFRTLRVIYAGMLSSLVVYWVVVMLTRRVGAIPAGRGAYSEMDWLRYPLYTVAAGVAVLALVLRTHLLRPDAVRRRTTGTGAPAYLNAIVAAHVVLFALAEIPAILGLALYFVGGYLVDFYALAGLALCAFAATYPREGRGAEVLGSLLAAMPGPGPSAGKP